MSEHFLDTGGRAIRSLAGLNSLPPAERDVIYLSLLPDVLFARFHAPGAQETSISSALRGHVDRARPIDAQGQPLFLVDGLPGAGSVEIRFYHQAGARDPVVYAHLADTPNNQIIVLLLVVNDPDAPRFDVDRDWTGERTKFGTLTRNIEAESAAMQAGLGPGQIRRGLKLSRTMLASFETFVSQLGHEMFFIEPLAYHTAILFERYGFTYSQGLKKMNEIHREFQPGGALFNRLDGSTPFRRPGAEKTVRGRSWAIHDGILGEPFSDLHMYKRVGQHAGICTFPDATW